MQLHSLLRKLLQQQLPHPAHQLHEPLIGCFSTPYVWAPTPLLGYAKLITVACAAAAAVAVDV